MNGKIVYPSGDPSALTYNFVKNYDYKPDIGIIETQDIQRAFDGTANSFAGADKKYFELTFTRALKTQFDFFTTLYRFHCSMDLYMDGDNIAPDATVIMVTAPKSGPEAAFAAGEPTYSFTIRFEEV